jgi:hypothetical protein
MDWITIVKDGETRRVRPHGLAEKQAQGWTLPGADPKPQQPQVVEVVAINLKAPKGKVK